MTASFLLAAPALPVVAAAAIALLRPDGRSAGRWAVRATALAFAAAVVVLVGAATGGSVSAVVEQADGSAWIGLHADRVGAVLAVLTTGVGLVVQSFARRALRGDLRERRFFLLAALLTGSTTAVAVSATLSLLTIFWIVTGTSLAALVAHRDGWPQALRAARRTGRSFLVGDAALAVATILAMIAVGEVDLRAAAAAAESLSPGELGDTGVSTLTAVTLLLAIAGISRSALVPLHRWLPATVAAPTPVSALLHAGVVNGAGVLLVRLAPLFGASAAATHLAFAVGAMTVLYATAVMLVRSDVKGNLAWSTAGQMGFMVVQVSVGAFSAALFHIVGHGMYKAALFLGSGGAVTAHLRHHLRPAPRRQAPRAARIATVLLIPGAALLVAYQLADPHLPLAGDLLVIVFAWATAARAADGWVRAAPFGPTPTIALAATGIVAGLLVYVGGLRLFEGFVVPDLPDDVPAAVDATVLGAVLAIAGIATAVLWLAPARSIDHLRTRLYALLVSSAAPLPPPDDGRPTRGSSVAGLVGAPPTRPEILVPDATRSRRRPR